MKGDTRSLDYSSYWDNGKENGNYYSILGIPLKGFIGVILGLYWGYIGIMENEMETTIMGYMGVLFWWLNLVRLDFLY